MPGHLSVCRACSAGLLRDLADVPSLDHHLELALTRQTRIDHPDAGRASDVLDDDLEVGLTVRRAPLPYDERARQAITILRASLVGWFRMLAVDEPRLGPACGAVCDHPSCTWIHRSSVPPNTLTGLARWLIRQRAALFGHQALVEAIEDLAAAVRQARQALDRPPATWYAGPCGVDGCGADLYVRHGARLTRCRVCGASHSATARERWLLRQVADHLGTATEIARALNAFCPDLTPAMIRGYAHRGRIVSHGADDIGRPLYRVGDVLELVNGRAQ
jgi:hypothetical protein